MAERGRPRCYERTEALEQAMKVFWQHGYEGSSISELTQAMGINSPTLYAAFTSKEALYKEAVGHYEETIGSGSAAILASAANARDGVEALLLYCAKSVADPVTPLGCMVALSATHCASGNESVGEFMVGRREYYRQILQDFLTQAQTRGELPASTDTVGLCHFYDGIRAALSMKAHDGVKAEELGSMIMWAMRAWPSYLE
jgi:AcrR family transcriptional regulator